MRVFFNYQIIRGAYSYSFIQDDRMDVAAVAGLYVIPLQFGVEAGTEKAEDTDFTAPLPVFGLRADFLLAPDWYLRQNLDLFFLEYKEFRGGISDIRVSVEYFPWEHWGMGLGFDVFGIRLRSDGEDYSGVDLVGNIESRYIGGLFYIRYRN